MCDLLGLGDQFIQLFVRADVELSEAPEELEQVLDRRISEDFRLAVELPGEPLGQVFDQSIEFSEKRLFGQIE